MKVWGIRGMSGSAGRGSGPQTWMLDSPGSQKAWEWAFPVSGVT